MSVTIILFGQLTDIAGSETITVEQVGDTDSLTVAVNQLYPAMAGIKYMIAVNKKVVKENTAINASSNLVLLPPFSGG